MVEIKEAKFCMATIFYLSRFPSQCLQERERERERIIIIMIIDIQ